MFLETLLRVLYVTGVSIREGIDYSNTGEVTEERFRGEPDRVPSDLLYFIVRSIQFSSDGWVNVVVTRC